jgi:hypothetical protein
MNIQKYSAMNKKIIGTSAKTKLVGVTTMSCCLRRPRFENGGGGGGGGTHSLVCAPPARFRSAQISKGPKKLSCVATSYRH